MKITPLTLEEAALAWASGKTVEVDSFRVGVGWQRILRPGETCKGEESDSVWSAYIFHEAALGRQDGKERSFRMVESASPDTPLDAPTA